MKNVDPQLVQAVAKDAATLALRSAEAFKQAALVPGLQAKVAELEGKLAEKHSKTAAEQQADRAKATEIANTLELRGFLPGTQKSAFIDRIIENPLDLVEVIEKLAAATNVPSMGSADPAEPIIDGPRDSYVAFCTGS